LCFLLPSSSVFELQHPILTAATVALVSVVVSWWRPSEWVSEWMREWVIATKKKQSGTRRRPHRWTPQHNWNNVSVSSQIELKWQ
jgi:hypothetical protein